MTSEMADGFRKHIRLDKFNCCKTFNGTKNSLNLTWYRKSNKNSINGVFVIK